MGRGQGGLGRSFSNTQKSFFPLALLTLFDLPRVENSSGQKRNKKLPVKEGREGEKQPLC